MSLESRAEQMRAEITDPRSVYSVIRAVLEKDSGELWALYHRNLTARNGGAWANPIDAEIAEIYDLRRADLPYLSLASNLDFVSGFSWTVSMYPIIDVGTKPGVPAIVMDELLRAIRKKRPNVTHQYVLDSLSQDPSGAMFLEEIARAEIPNGNLELIGALKAITGIRKMHESLTAA